MCVYYFNPTNWILTGTQTFLCRDELKGKKILASIILNAINNRFLTYFYEMFNGHVCKNKWNDRRATSKIFIHQCKFFGSFHLYISAHTYMVRVYTCMCKYLSVNVFYVLFTLPACASTTEQVTSYSHHLCIIKIINI